MIGQAQNSQAPVTDNDEETVCMTTALPSAAILKQTYVVSSQLHDRIAEQRRAIRNVIIGKDPRVLVVMGPCSLHCDKAALEYAEHLCALQARYADKLLLVMRTYLEKPRTTVGWKGMLYDPDMDGSNDLARGLDRSRNLLVKITEMGLPIATEVLNPLAFQYFDDLISWVAIGARTTESQTHREIASALPCVVGFKNGTDGGLDVAINALRSAANPHVFFGADVNGQVSVVRSRGNTAGQVVLRGGKHGTNYDALHVAKAKKALNAAGLVESVMVDCSHENSGKDHTRQANVVENVAKQLASGCKVIRGLMLESHLKSGRQNISNDLDYGRSVTDACIDWAESEALIATIARAI
jgi:3-deoxy-7-phosphoheptulonate synthase